MDFKKCGINTVTPMTTDDKTDVSTPDKADLQQFTPEQIEEFCKEMESLKMIEQIRPRIEWVEKGVQIIKQLQEELVCLNLPE